MGCYLFFCVVVVVVEEALCSSFSFSGTVCFWVFGGAFKGGISVLNLGFLHLHFFCNKDCGICGSLRCESEHCWLWR